MRTPPPFFRIIPVSSLKLPPTVPVSFSIPALIQPVSLSSSLGINYMEV
ncbi:hypothetical protein LINPERPRIM_LOCUS14457 [Linum perenne]